jgi:hypothetical protein
MSMKTAILVKYFSLLMGAGAILVISSCHEEDDPEILYPAIGFYGDNILMKGKTEYAAEQDYSLQAKLPEGQKVKIIITGRSVTFPTGVWYNASATNNWAISKFDQNTYTQIYQSIDGGHTCDHRIYFEVGTFQIDYYENDAAAPTATKTIQVDH